MFWGKVWKLVGQNMVPEPKNDNLVYVRYKFKYEDKVIFKKVSMYVFQELKNASTIEYCEIINWYGQIDL